MTREKSFPLPHDCKAQIQSPDRTFLCFHMPEGASQLGSPRRQCCTVVRAGSQASRFAKLVLGAWKNPRNNIGAVVSGLLCHQGFDGTAHDERKNKDIKALGQSDSEETDPVWTGF